MKYEGFYLAEPIFHSIQGQGVNIGKNVVFIRLPLCNLSCPDCDSKFSWEMNQGLFVKFEEIYNYIVKTRANGVVITGGQPMLYQDEICQFMDVLKEIVPVQIQTNGTIPVSQNMINHRYNIRYNISPKISSFYPDVKDSIIYDSLKTYMYSGSKFIFKFVVNSQSDIQQIRNIQNDLQILDDEIYLMPACITTEQQFSKQQEIVNMCLKYGYNYSPRLHILIWNNKRGV